MALLKKILIWLQLLMLSHKKIVSRIRRDSIIFLMIYCQPQIIAPIIVQQTIQKPPVTSVYLKLFLS